MEGDIAATYTLIYRFLRQRSQNKAAEAVKKAAKAFVVLRDDIEQDGPPLEDIIKEWKAKKGAKPVDADPSSEDSDSSDDSSSDSGDNSRSDSSSEDTSGSKNEDDHATSGSDDSSDDSGKETKAKELAPKGAERDTSTTLSSAGENAWGVAKQVNQIPAKEDKNKDCESDSSDSDSSDSDGSDAEMSSSSDSSGSSDSNEEEKESASNPESSSSSEDTSDSETQDNKDAHVAKRRKTSENGAAVTIAVTTGSQQTAKALQRKEKPPRKVTERFQRVKVRNLAPELFLNNGYEARGGAANDYGERAHRDLIVTRGAGFRKEKNKKKRGSYRGGEITMENHSIRFDF